MRSICSRSETSVIEAVGNAITHGNQSNINKKITVSIQVNKNKINIEVQDEGTGFDVNSLPDPLAPENLLNPRGRGIFLIKSLMDKVMVDSNGKNSTLIMEKVFECDIE